MNMSEDVTGVTLSLAEKAVTAGINITEKVIDLIAKLFQGLMALQREREARQGGVRASDLTDIRAGAVRYRDLVANAHRTGDALSTSENGLSREDMRAVSRKAREYGIPVAFTNPRGRENIYAAVRSSDVPIFRQICTEVIRDKLAENPETLGNFKCEAWEIPFLTAEMKKYDVPAMFPKSNEGSFCLYEKKDERIIKIARDEFLSKCQSLEKETTFDRDEQGFYTIKDLRTGKAVSFDEVPDRETLAGRIQTQLGYDRNKADMCAAKFGQEMLQDTQRAEFFGKSAQQAFSNVQSNVTLEGESVLVRPYQCWHLTPKEDAKPRLVYRDPESGKFAVLEPQKMTRREMRAVLADRLGITDRAVLDALADKAERVTNFYARQNAELYQADRTFETEDFPPDTLKTHTFTGASGEQYSQTFKPVSSVEQSIRRTERNALGEPDNTAFTVNCTFHAVGIGENGEPSETAVQHQLDLSLADKKTGIRILTELYKEQGIPESAATSMAKEVFRKAEMQSPEKVIQIEEVRADSMTVAFGMVSANISAADKQAAADQITETFGVPAETAEKIVEKAQEIREEAEQPETKNAATTDNQAEQSAEHPDRTETEKPTAGGNGHERHTAQTQTELNTLHDTAAPKPSAPALPEVPNIPAPPTVRRK